MLRNMITLKKSIKRLKRVINEEESEEDEKKQNKNPPKIRCTCDRQSGRQSVIIDFCEEVNIVDNEGIPACQIIADIRMDKNGALVKQEEAALFQMLITLKGVEKFCQIGKRE